MANRVAEVFDVGDTSRESERPTLLTGEPSGARAADRLSTPVRRVEPPASPAADRKTPVPPGEPAASHPADRLKTPVPPGEPPASHSADRLSTPLPSERSLPVPPPLMRLPFRPSAQPSTAAPSKAPSGPRPSGPPRTPSSLVAEAKPHKSELEQLRAELAARDARIGQLELRLREHDEFSRELAACDARLDQLSRYCGAVERIRHQLHEAVATVDELVARTSCIPELEQRIARLESQAEAPALPSAPADDLKRISGIGPAFERALHDLGVRTYAEVAAWTAEDIERIARLLRVNAARVKGWPEQARALAPPTPEPGG